MVVIMMMGSVSSKQKPRFAGPLSEIIDLFRRKKRNPNFKVPLSSTILGSQSEPLLLLNRKLKKIRNICQLNVLFSDLCFDFREL